MQLKKLNDKSIDQLFEAILTLKDVEECYVFFDDLCTVNEIQSLSQRLEVARMLGKGHTYNQIETETGASTATISLTRSSCPRTQPPPGTITGCQPTCRKSRCEPCWTK